jgi:hypothetical protein
MTGVFVPSHDGVCVLAVQIIGQWRSWDRVAGDGVHLVRSTSLSSTKDDFLADVFLIVGIAESLLQPFVGPLVNGMISSDENLRA